MRCEMNARVHSQVQTASYLHDNKVALVIPCYQRPYVWPSEDVIKLLDDIIAACEANEPHYYIGTVLTALIPKNASDHAITYELIDGQQRMTTLMLLALAFCKYMPESDLARLAVLGKMPRLTFTIRQKVQALLGCWAGLDDHHSPSDDAIKNDPYLTNLAAALKSVSDRLHKLYQDKGEQKLEAVGNYLFSKVKWVNNVIPNGTDLNRLFATMNTRGVQLEQTDILKSQLLHKITLHKSSFDAIWQACENLDNYFERNVRQLFPDADWKNLTYDQLAEYSQSRFPLQDLESDTEGMTISQLAQVPPKDEKKKITSDESEIYCRSIISFGLLLLHAYRIFRSQREQGDVDVRVNDSRLNECFSNFVDSAIEQDVIEFIACLWKVRYQFDRWVVKWVERETENEEQLRLSSVSLNNSNNDCRLTRSSLETSNLTQLQSVRYFTGERTAQYWLTSFLGLLVKNKISDRDDVNRLLERIDNQLSLSLETQKEASFQLLSGSSQRVRSIDEIIGELHASKGTSFEHYWFQKLDYILWREQAQLKLFDSTKLSRYRITSKNSVEHVYPQHEEHGRKLEDSYLHSFGNLVLLSPGENSSYSNQTVKKKRADFDTKPRYDSLKLAHIFHTMGSGEWDKDSISIHQNAMFELIKKHYKMAD